MNPTPRMRLAALAAGSGGLLLLMGAMSAGAQQPPDPSGDNGTIKIDDVDFDDHPDNEPHVGCTFQVDFYGFDAGGLVATVVFTAMPPTVPDDGEDELLTDEIVLEDDAAGGGTDLDGSGTYDLTSVLADIAPHPEQGWHVRVDITVEDGTEKSKVFWVEQCGVPPTTSSSTTTSSTSSTSSTTSTTAPSSTTSSTTSTTAPGSTTTTTAPGSTTTTAPGGPTTTAGGGAAPPQGPAAPPGAPTQLPRTGVGTMALTVLGGLLLAAASASA